MDVTDDMRKAVYEADCAAYGHLLDIANCFGHQPGSNPGTYASTVCGPDSDTLPHLTCRRCHKVWLVIEEPGDCYADAVARLAASTPADLTRPAPKPDVR